MANFKIKLTPLERLEIGAKDLVTSRIIGKYKSVFKGKGIEFEDFRDYTPSDDASFIDWKASVRANKILVKEFIEERNIDVFFLIDASSSMIFGSESKLKLEYAAELAASLAYTVIHAGDSVGFAMFSDKIGENSLPNRKREQFYILTRALSDSKNYGGKKNFEKAIGFCMASLKKVDILIIISDFIGLNGNWERALKLAGGKFEVIGFMVRDKRDREFPKDCGTIVLEDAFSEQQILADTNSIGSDYREHVKKQEDGVRGAFLKSNNEILILQTDEPFIKPLTKFFKMRSMKWR